MCASTIVAHHDRRAVATPLRRTDRVHALADGRDALAEFGISVVPCSEDTSIVDKRAVRLASAIECLGQDGV